MRTYIAFLSLLSGLIINPLLVPQADAVQTLNTHHISQKDDNLLRIDGPDPYLVFSASGASDNAKYIIFHFELRSGVRTVQSIPMELFFHAPDAGKPERFDPLYRVRFKVPLEQLSPDSPAIALALPERAFRSHNRLRLDIDRCQGCQLKMVSYPRISSQLPPSVNQIEPYRIYNGAQSLPEEGLTITNTRWQAHDLTVSHGRYRLTGRDPYISSPPFDVATEQLAGVYFSLTTDADHSATQDFQLFYATDQHAFVESASTSVTVPVSNNGEIEFYIPLGFLARERPRAVALERIRLDMTTDYPGTSWALREIRLLPMAKAAQYEPMTPTRMLQAKHQRAHGLALIQKSLKKIFADPAFVVVYLLIILATALGFWRWFRS